MCQHTRKSHIDMHHCDARQMRQGLQCTTAHVGDASTAVCVGGTLSESRSEHECSEDWY